jgi:ComF family protein
MPIAAPAPPDASHGARWLVLPERCRICQRWPARTLCADCLTCFADREQRCTRCAQVLPENSRLSQCLTCLRQPPMQDWTLACQNYGYPWSMLLHQLKFGDDVGLARALGRQLGQTPGLAPQWPHLDWIVPLPLAAARLAERGYNQSLLLARAMVAGLPVRQRHKLQPDLLVKSRDPLPQHGLTRAQRQVNVRRAYLVPAAQQPRVRGSSVLLVDDVMTTGASLEAAVRALRQAGARHVGALVLARA